VKMVLVTGGSGFIARSVMPSLLARGWAVRATVRKVGELTRLPVGAVGVVTGDLAAVNDWKPLVDGVDAVVHLAARVHQIRDGESDSENAYRRMNVAVTEALAAASAASCVRRFVFLSSVKAIGEGTVPGQQWDERSALTPRDAYGRSKRDAELRLAALARRTGLEIVLLRVPLVYGPGAKGNVARLFTAVQRGAWLPLGAVENLRSLLYVGNLVDAIALSLERPSVAGETFLVSDGEDLSTPELIRRIGRALKCTPRLIALPAWFLRAGGRVLGRSEEVDRLLGHLTINSSKFRRVTNWKPPYSVEQGLEATAAWFKSDEAGL
jgi:nucleoside-diphosphate-sugar epimerase